MYPSDQDKPLPRLLNRDKGNSVLKSRGSSEFYGLTDRESNMAVALKFILATGEQKAIHYHDIISPMEYNGNSLIKLSTTTFSVEIQGANLDDLFDYIIQHRVRWVREPEDSFKESNTHELKIRSLMFKT